LESALELSERRAFLKRGGWALATLLLSPFLDRATLGAAHRYKLAPESILPPDIRKAPEDVREAYRFALANRNTLRYIPCYCGCGEQGHTSNASCYFKDDSTPEKPVFDRMSVG
jgi:Protein of unknown function with PCYCGC motif